MLLHSSQPVVVPTQSLLQEPWLAEHCRVEAGVLSSLHKDGCQFNYRQLCSSVRGMMVPQSMQVVKTGYWELDEDFHRSKDL